MLMPNLLIIGAMKCGTTSLHTYLDMHPEIQMSDTKEINFFSNDKNYKKGLSWYSSFFKEGYAYNGEASVNYSKRHAFPEVASRILKDLGKNIKLIYIVREPIDRLQSNFTDSKTYGHVPSFYSIDKFVEEKGEDNPYLKTSMYYYQIEAYLPDFDLKNMYFLKADDLKAQPQATMDGVFEFLGLKPVQVETTVLNSSSSKTYMSSRYIKLSQSPFGKAIKCIVPSKIMLTLKEGKAFQKLSRRKINPKLDVLSEQSRELLEHFLADDIKKFEALTKIKF